MSDDVSHLKAWAERTQGIAPEDGPAVVDPLPEPGEYRNEELPVVLPPREAADLAT